MLLNLLLLQGWPLSSCALPFSFFPRGVEAGSGSGRLRTRLSTGHMGGGERKLGQSPDVMGFRESDICGFLRAWKFHWLTVSRAHASWGLVRDHPEAPSRG